MTGRRANQLRYWAFPYATRLKFVHPHFRGNKHLVTHFRIRKSRDFFLPSAPNGVRTRVTAVKGRCPRPLDDGDHRTRGKEYRLAPYGQNRATAPDGDRGALWPTGQKPIEASLSRRVSTGRLKYQCLFGQSSQSLTSSAL